MFQFCPYRVPAFNSIKKPNNRKYIQSFYTGVFYQFSCCAVRDCELVISMRNARPMFPGHEYCIRVAARLMLERNASSTLETYGLGLRTRVGAKFFRYPLDCLPRCLVGFSISARLMTRPYTYSRVHQDPSVSALNKVDTNSGLFPSRPTSVHQL